MTVFSSTLDSVVEAVEDAETSVCRRALEAGFSESEQFFIGLAVREILVNAIKHGNSFDPKKKVGFQISREGDELIVEVTDQGEGFEVESVPDPRLPENLSRLSGRGIAMAQGIMDEFSVDRTSSGGAHVRMVKRLRTQPQPPASHLITSTD
jgi:serine/threonine-protein kinase RsbW